MLDQNYLDTAHLLRRAGFGASPETIRAAAQAGIANTIDALLHPELGPQDTDDSDMVDKLAELVPDRKKNQAPDLFVKLWWTHRMLTTQHPLVEKMVLFWHGHFTSKLGDGDDMLAQNQLFRREALGNFRTLALAVSRDPAMLKYLNGNQNYKAHPNENYGRELMELFTCGIGNYTEDDVKAAARAFTGWNLRQDGFRFNPRQHDDDPKTFLGKTGNWNGNDIVDILVAHPATANRLCKQLFEYFAYPNPEPVVLSALVQTYYASGYDIRSVVGQILRSNAFFSQKARNAIIKCPVQFVIGSIKMLGIEQAFDVTVADIDAEADPVMPPASAAGSAPAATNPNPPPDNPIRAGKVGRLAGLVNYMRMMGQDILAPPSVKGWDGEEAWINTSTLLNRINFANRISQQRPLYRFLEPSVQDWADRNNVPETTAWVEYLTYALGPLNLAPAAHDTLVAFANAQGPYAGPDSQFAAQNQDPVVDYAISQSGSAPPTPADDTTEGRRSVLKRNGRLRKQIGPAPFVEGNSGRMLALIPLIMATPEYQVC